MPLSVSRSNKPRSRATTRLGAVSGASCRFWFSGGDERKDVETRVTGKQSPRRSKSVVPALPSAGLALWIFPEHRARRDVVPRGKKLETRIVTGPQLKLR